MCGIGGGTEMGRCRSVLSVSALIHLPSSQSVWCISWPRTAGCYVFVEWMKRRIWSIWTAVLFKNWTKEGDGWQRFMNITAERHPAPSRINSACSKEVTVSYSNLIDGNSLISKPTFDDLILIQFNSSSALDISSKTLSMVRHQKLFLTKRVKTKCFSTEIYLWQPLSARTILILVIPGGPEGSHSQKCTVHMKKIT